MKWIPNVLSLSRGCIIAPLVLWFSFQRSWKLAFVLLVVGGITDGLDGFLAVRLNARTKLGGYFDCFSDGALIGAIILGLTVTGVLPWWVIVLASAIGLMFFCTERMCPPPISNFSAGLAPFWGVSCGIAIGIVTAIQAFGPYTVYLLLPATVAIAGPMILKMKMGRIRELLMKLK